MQWLNGDGAISSFRIKDGNVDFKQRFVQTEKFRVEATENRALLGKPPCDLSGTYHRLTAFKANIGIHGQTWLSSQTELQPTLRHSLTKA